MKFWDEMIQFHQHVSKDYSTGGKGLSAVQYLREVLEPHWKEGGSNRHPLRHLVGRASEDWYGAILEYATKLRALKRIPGFEFVESRFGDPSEYLSAWAEMEVALMLTLGGFNVAFLDPGSDPTPDLLVRRDDEIFTVEVGSLHPPDEDTRLMNAVNNIITAGFAKVFSGGVVVGGIISRPPSDAELVRLDREVKEAIEKSLERRKVERVNLPGVATIYVAPRDLAGEMPEDCRGQFRTIPLYKGPPEQKIARAIRNKQKQVGVGGAPAILVLFDRSVGIEALTKLFEDPGDDIGAVLSTLHSVMGLIIVAPMAFRSGPTPPSRVVEGGRTLMRINTGIQAWADVLVWENRHSDTKMPPATLDCIENYHRNLTSLPK